MTTEQKPLNSGFGPKSTAREVLAGRDLTGKIAIVTGGYSGVGLETTRALAEAGAIVVVPARTQEKSRTALTGGSFLDSGPVDGSALAGFETSREGARRLSIFQRDPLRRCRL